MSAPSHRHWLEREDVNDVTVVRFTVPKFHDEEEIRTVFGQIFSLVDDVGRHKLVVSFKPVITLVSAAIGKLVMLNRKVQAAQGRLALCHVGPQLSEVFRVMHLDEVFAIYPGEQEALRSFDQPGPA